MSEFYCPIERCVNHVDGNCKLNFVKFESRANDYDVALVCPYQDFGDLLNDQQY